MEHQVFSRFWSGRGRKIATGLPFRPLGTTWRKEEFTLKNCNMTTWHQEDPQSQP